MARTPKAQSAGAFNADFARETVVLRGTPYTFRELTVGEYDDLVKACTSVNDAGEELLDQRLLAQLMTVESCESPKLTPEKLRGLGMRIGRKLNTIASRLNYGEEPEGEEDKDPDIQEGDPEEGKD